MSNTSTSTVSGKRRSTNIDGPGKRRNTLMPKINKVKTLGKKINVKFNDRDEPLDKEGDELSSYFGVLAREHVPISMIDWRLKEHKQLKERIWNEICEAFTVPIELKNNCLMRVGEAARLFRHELYNDLVKDNLNDPSVLKRPEYVLKRYGNITEEDWIKFVEYRRSEVFKKSSDNGKEIARKNVYKSRTGRNGYRKLDQQKVRFTCFILYSMFHNIY